MYLMKNKSYNKLKLFNLFNYLLGIVKLWEEKRNKCINFSTLWNNLITYTKKKIIINEETTFNKVKKKYAV